MNFSFGKPCKNAIHDSCSDEISPWKDEVQIRKALKQNKWDIDGHGRVKPRKNIQKPVQFEPVPPVALEFGFSRAN